MFPFSFYPGTWDLLWPEIRPSAGHSYSSPCGEHRARDLLPTALPPLSCSMI